MLRGAFLFLAPFYLSSCLLLSSPSYLRATKGASKEHQRKVTPPSDLREISVTSALHAKIRIIPVRYCQQGGAGYHSAAYVSADPSSAEAPGELDRHGGGQVLHFPRDCDGKPRFPGKQADNQGIKRGKKQGRRVSRAVA